ncbi:MAG: RraA family protein [Gammaproteobacteria bacterium]|nr:RraA family protein [Gammaproteobacteria bacterium]NKB65174.1 RraA family protein [Gammaproteobacteria bacterium]
MIEEPVKLTIRKPSRRPNADQIVAFEGVPTGFIVDAMDGIGALSPEIRPVGDGRDLPYNFVGPALTVDTGPADILALLGALKFIQAGDVVVSSFSDYQHCAACGDRLAGMMKNNGAKALVTDGPVRDYAGIVEVGLPIWCKGINPNSPVGQGPGKIGMPIQIGGMEVETGDMVVADRDGVIVVPYEIIDEVIKRLVRIKELETALDKEVVDGLKLPAAIETLLESDQVRFID